MPRMKSTAAMVSSVGSTVVLVEVLSRRGALAPSIAMAPPAKVISLSLTAKSRPFAICVSPFSATPQIS